MAEYYAAKCVLWEFFINLCNQGKASSRLSMYAPVSLKLCTVILTLNLHIVRYGEIRTADLSNATSLVHINCHVIMLAQQFLSVYLTIAGFEPCSYIVHNCVNFPI